jgi:hypothetical protein
MRSRRIKVLRRKEHYVPIAKEAERRAREEENKNLDEATAYGRCV